MKIQEEKFSKLDHIVRVPTLLIGIGGIGGRIVSSVYDQLNVHDRSYIEMVVMDTNINDLSDVEEKGISCIQTSEGRIVQDYLKANPEYREWFPTNPLINRKNLIDGAGQIRAVSRLGALASIQAGNFKKLDHAIDNIKKNRGNNLESTMKVMIVGSITGGTGSGLGVQLPFYIRKTIAERAKISDILIRGLFLTADITEEKQQTTESKDAMYVNEYAFIRELNAFYKAQMVKDEDIKITIENYDKGEHNIGVSEDLRTANRIPYDFMFLIEKVDSKSTNIGGLETYETKAAKIVKNQLFSPVSSGQYSAEDNLIIPFVEKGGMNRYCGAGVSSAVYPRDEVERYCTLRFANNSVSQFWLRLDRDFEDANLAQQQMMATNSNLAPLKLSRYFIDRFDALSGESSEEATYYMTQLGREVREVERDKDGNVIKTVYVTESIIDSIDKYIASCKANIGLDTEKNRCAFTESDYSVYESAVANVKKMINRLTEYRASAVEAVENLSLTCSEEILPSGITAALKTPEKRRHSIYNVMKKRHPITNRYIIYKLLEVLPELKKKADDTLKTLATANPFAEDFDSKTDGTQTPVQAFENAKPGWIRRFVGDQILKQDDFNSAHYKSVLKVFESAVETEVAGIDAYITNKLKSNIYTSLIEKLTELSKIYEEFFESMKDIVEDREEEIRILERKYNKDNNRLVDGDWIVCADEICLKSIYSDVIRNAKVDVNAISDEVKESLYNELFEEMTKVLKKKLDANIDVGGYKSARNIFESGVLAPMKGEMLRFGRRYIDIGILEAIKKEYHANVVRKENNPDHYFIYKSEEEFIRFVMNKIFQLATPYISYSPLEKEQLPLAVTFAINEDVMKKEQGIEEGDCNYAAAADFFKIKDSYENTPIVDPAIDGNELTCYIAVYNLRIENLHFFKDGMRAHRAYTKRINDVVNKMYEMTESEDSYLLSVHPHLDKRWHNHAYLPLLNSESDVAESKRIRLAFLLSFVLDACKYIEHDDYGMCWTYKQRKTPPHPFYINNDEVIEKEGLDALLDGFHYNDVIKCDVLKRAAEIIHNDDVAELLTGTDETSIVNYSFVNLLCSVADIKEDSKERKISSIFDIIYFVYLRTKSIKEMCALVNVIAAYLYKYCYNFANGLRNETAKMLDAVVTKINNSSVQYKGAEKTAPRLYEFWNEVFQKENHEDLKNYLIMVD